MHDNFWAAGILAMTAFPFLLGWYICSRYDKKEQASWRYGKATILSQERAKGTEQTVLALSIPELHSTRVFNCKVSDTLEEQLHRGDVVDVMYRPQTIAGEGSAEVMLIDVKPTKFAICGRVFLAIGLAFVAGAIILTSLEIGWLMSLRHAE